MDNLLPNLVHSELYIGIQMSTRISAGVDALVSLLFINMIRIDCKITKFSSHLFAYFLGNNYNIGKLTSAATKE